MMTRRDLFKNVSAGFGAVGMADMLSGATHFAPKAKHFIFLFLNGGPSQVDTFDPKPMLQKMHGKPSPAGNLKTERKTGTLLGSPFQFKKYGQSGIEVSEIFSGVGSVIDEFCVIRSMHVERPNHEPSLFTWNTGTPLSGRPSFGSWLSYGLGSMNKNLPGYMVMCPGIPVVGPQLWSSAFLPAAHQGVHIKNDDKADQLIPYIGAAKSADVQRRQIDLLGKINALRTDDPEIENSLQSMEVAFRMQTEAPEVLDLSKETEATRTAYGNTNFGRGCLMARRLIEKGVRTVQIYHGNGQPWDSHDDIMRHKTLAKEADPAIAALIKDLKQRGMLQDTVVLVGGEFGRTPAVEVSGLVSVQNGRDHNNHGFSMLIAGGGFKGGTVYGATDEFGFKAVEKPVHPHDVQATILNQLGLDHTRLTYRYSGRDFRLTDVEGTVIKDLLA